MLYEVITLVVPLWRTCCGEVERMFVRWFVTDRDEVGLAFTLCAVVVAITLPVWKQDAHTPTFFVHPGRVRSSIFHVGVVTHQCRYRITSYNVCYTKLLRNIGRQPSLNLSLQMRPYCGPGSSPEDLALTSLFDHTHEASPNSSRRAVFQGAYLFVITSYSIHYTKLYEMP